MAVLCGMPTIQHSVQSGPLSVHKLFTFWIGRSMPSITYVPATERCQRYLPCYLFSVSNSSLLFFMSVSQATQRRTWFTQYRTRTSDGTLPKIWVGFVYGTYSPGEWFWIGCNGKMKTRHPLEGSFSSEFPAICNHCVLHSYVSYGDLKSEDVEVLSESFAVLVKRRLTAKISKFCSGSFNRHTDRRCCVQISWNLADGKWVKSCVIYLTKNKNKISRASQTVARYCADRAQNLPGPAPNNVLIILIIVLQVSSKPVYFQWSYSWTREHRQNAP